MSGFLQRGLAGLFMLLMVGACAQVPAPPVDKVCSNNTPPQLVLPLPPPVLVIDPMVSLMQYVEEIHTLTAPALSAKYKAATLAYAKQASDLNRLKLVLLMTLPDSTIHDSSAALILLNDMIKHEPSSSTSLDDFAVYLTMLLTQQQHMANTLTSLTQKLKDESTYAENLQHKINAVKSMEKNLIDTNKR